MKRVLLVDDQPMVLRLMRLALEKAGYQVDVAIDGEDALAKIADSCPDIMVTDIEMPRMSGKELCLHLQDTMPDRKFPIFVSTSLTDSQHREWTNEISNLVFLEKPISIRKLQSVVSELLGPDDVTIAGHA